MLFFSPVVGKFLTGVSHRLRNPRGSLLQLCCHLSLQSVYVPLSESPITLGEPLYRASASAHSVFVVHLSCHFFPMLCLGMSKVQEWTWALIYFLSAVARGGFPLLPSVGRLPSSLFARSPNFSMLPILFAARISSFRLCFNSPPLLPADGS